MSQAMIRGMQDEDNDQFVAYFLPVKFPPNFQKFYRKFQDGKNAGKER